MATRQTLEEKLDRLRELEDAPVTDALRAELKKMMRSASGILAGKAARLAGEKKLSELIPDVVNMFERFLKNPVKTDPGCRAKCGAVEALTALAYDRADLFLVGLHHVQKEPAWGPPVDTADKLRGLCAYALYATGHPRLFYHLVELLQDPEPIARIAAIQVLGDIESEVSELLLRMKAGQGDEEPEVLGACLTALMRIAPLPSLSFVAGFLKRGNPVATEAGFALGESRLPEACALLIETRGDRLGDIRDALLLPIALTRQDSAFSYLLEVIAEEHPASAEAGVRAIRVLAADADHVDRVAAVVRARQLPGLEAVFREEFAPA